MTINHGTIRQFGVAIGFGVVLALCSWPASAQTCKLPPEVWDPIFWMNYQQQLTSGQTCKLPPEVWADFTQLPPRPPSNLVTGVDIDRFIGNPFLSSVQMVHGSILARSILRHGDPYKAGDPGAVLEYRKDFQWGTMLAHNSTPLEAVDDQLFIYIEDGKGTLDDGEEFWDLKEGTAALIPPRLKFRITNGGDEPLHTLLLTWTPQMGAKPASTILVRDVYAVPFHTCNGGTCDWSYFSKNLFNVAHGLSSHEAFHVVYVPPMSTGEPHAHVRGWEEVWTKLPPYGAYLTLGSAVRDMPPNTNTVHLIKFAVSSAYEL